MQRPTRTNTARNAAIIAATALTAGLTGCSTTGTNTASTTARTEGVPYAAAHTNNKTGNAMTLRAAANRAPQPVSLGAGDRLGQRLFERHTTERRATTTYVAVQPD